MGQRGFQYGLPEHVRVLIQKSRDFSRSAPGAVNVDEFVMTQEVEHFFKLLNMMRAGFAQSIERMKSGNLIGRQVRTVFVPAEQARFHAVMDGEYFTVIRSRGISFYNVSALHQGSFVGHGRILNDIAMPAAPMGTDQDFFFFELGVQKFIDFPVLLFSKCHRYYPFRSSRLPRP